MIKIVGSTEGLRIKQLWDFKQMLSDEYLFNTRIAQTKFIFEQWFKGGDADFTRDQRLRLLNISLGLPAMIAEKFADYTGQPNCPYAIDVFEHTFAFSWAGYSVMKVRLVEGELKVEFAEPDGYVKYDDGAEQLLTVIENEDQDGKVKTYIFQQFYRPGTIENSLYEIKASPALSDNAIYGDEVPLDTIPATRGMIPVEKTGLNVNPVVVVHNAFVGSRKYGTSEIKRIRSLLNSIEIQVVNIQDQLLKHLAAVFAVPASKLAVDKETGLVNMRNMQIIGMEVGDTPPQYVSNQNPLIEKSFTTIENLLRQIGAILSLPVEFMNLKGEGGVESAEAKGIRISSFLKKIERIRSKMEEGIDKVHEIAKEWGSAVEDGEFVVIWPPVFPINKKEEVAELGSALNAGIISKVRGIMRYLGVTEEEARKELEVINAENATVDESQLAV